MKELALFALSRTKINDIEYDNDDVVDARASTSGNGVTVDTTHSPDHFDHSLLASVTDDEDSTGTNVQVGSRFHSSDNTALMTERSMKELKEDIAEYIRIKKENIAEYTRIIKEGKEKREKEKKEEDEEFRKRMKKKFGQAGSDEESIEKISKMGMEQGHGNSINTKTRDLRRPATVRVHRKHMSPETLNKYKLPWEWDEVNTILPPLSSF